ncbi:hypothetical protein HMPREF1581_00687 [Gardnerella vaginalis JCP8108]|uniref:Uncharacterized protein n=1 Tax=Gardnerella vaginalis JCP8108 TaxID=1261066 RepID=S4GHE4_GARVA|nr:hypothetical protein HMPREF1581_00687 [Gardnerella vaginalis JCP8108]
MAEIFAVILPVFVYVLGQSKQKREHLPVFVYVLGQMVNKSRKL